MSRAAWDEARLDELERRERERREALELDEDAETAEAVGKSQYGRSMLRPLAAVSAFYEPRVVSSCEDDLEAVYGRNYDR